MASKKDKVVRTRLSADDYAAVDAAAKLAGMTVSAFVRSLALEGAGVLPFMNEADRAIMELLGQDMLAIGNALNQAVRALNTGCLETPSDLVVAAADARAVVITVAAELAGMTKRAGVARRARER
ncbi:plasmid mobilization relaxosome protein MobC [Mesorhizobium sp. B2-4-15]|uniref:plasmid mobilization protein n=1 Tax=Mesorhizobium sp. B2-4-15 TaxID=2589934 RepID=UPI001FEF2DF3|nr:plasmid mobilization relaxosome protein MobC [Mesorhizobium sp. B2-4-15]